MRIAETLGIASVILLGVTTTSCGSDAGKPTTLQQQQAAMHAPPPSPEALKQAMSNVHFKTPSGSNQAPPPGTALPGAPSAGK